jgi:hypothetical protein
MQIMRTHLAIAVVSCSCGGVDLINDAHVDTGANSDVGTDAAPACDITKLFGPPEPVRFVNTSADERWGWMSPDLLTLYYSGTTSGSSDHNIFTATRSFPGGNFVAAGVLAGVNTAMYYEDRPALTADGLTMFLDAAGFEIHVSTRASVTADFSEHGAAINDGGVDRNPWISEDGRTLYFSSNRSGNPDLYRTTRPDATSAFADAQPIVELNTTTDELAPVLSRDGLELYFSRYLGLGDTGIFRATRAATSDPFTDPMQVGELAGDGENFPSWLSPDRCTLLFTSTRPGGQGSWDIWTATRLH